MSDESLKRNVRAKKRDGFGASIRKSRGGCRQVGQRCRDNCWNADPRNQKAVESIAQAEIRPFQENLLSHGILIQICQLSMKADDGVGSYYHAVLATKNGILSSPLPL